jgi:hypothetical protein
MHTGFSSQVTGFYAQKKVGGFLPQKDVQFGPRSGPRADSRPDHPAVDRTNPAYNKMLVWPVILRGAETFWQATRQSGLQSSPAGLTAGPSGLHFGAAKLTVKLHRELLPMARFPPPYKYPFS